MDRSQAAEVLGISLLDSKNLAKTKYLQKLQEYQNYTQHLLRNGDVENENEYENILKTHSAYLVFIGEKNALVGDELHNVPIPEEPGNLQEHAQVELGDTSYEGRSATAKTINDTTFDSRKAREDLLEIPHINLAGQEANAEGSDTDAANNFFKTRSSEFMTQWQPLKEWGPPSIVFENENNAKHALDPVGAASEATRSIQDSLKTNNNPLQEYRHNALPSSSKPWKTALYILLGGGALILIIGIGSLVIEFINTAEIIIVE